LAGFTTTPTLLMPGTNCANVPTSLALRSGATLLLPVALPPGCARLAASPDPTGSETPKKTIGIVEVARRAARAEGVDQATMTSTLLCKTSEMRPGSCANEPFGQRTSMDRFFPSVQPCCWSASRKALSIAGSDAIYTYLTVVFELVAWWTAENRALERAQKALRLRHIIPFDNEDPFAAIIRCTADPAKVDKRTRSKWARVLRRALEQKTPSEPLVRFIKRKGGINECAAKFAGHLRRSRQSL
jgi:hypothetical protein